MKLEASSLSIRSLCALTLVGAPKGEKANLAEQVAMDVTVL
jgi:hypothetical protein